MLQPIRRKQLYEGTGKILFEGPEPTSIVQHFKDELTNSETKDTVTIPGKGVLNNRISEFIMAKLEGLGISTHFIRSLNMREQLIKKADILPVRITVRNIASGCIARRFGIEEGTVLPKPIMEFSLKNEALGNPIVNDDHIITFGWADPFDLEEIKITSFRINDFLSGLFLGAGIRLIDFRLEFGRIYVHEIERIILADEISPDTCRLWDLKTNEKMDKDRFNLNLGGVAEAYKEVARRLRVLSENEITNINDIKDDEQTDEVNI
jgi:phosphoribosylaminoimidazole-succinocarboxamide synthase